MVRVEVGQQPTCRPATDPAPCRNSGSRTASVVAFRAYGSSSSLLACCVAVGLTGALPPGRLVGRCGEAAGQPLVCAWWDGVAGQPLVCAWRGGVDPGVGCVDPACPGTVHPARTPRVEFSGARRAELVCGWPGPVLEECVTSLEKLLATAGIDDAIHVSAPRRRGHTQDLLAAAVSLFAHTDEARVRITAGDVTYLLVRGGQLEREAIVGVRYPTGHTVTRSINRVIDRELARSRPKG